MGPEQAFPVLLILGQRNGVTWGPSLVDCGVFSFFFFFLFHLLRLHKAVILLLPGWATVTKCNGSHFCSGRHIYCCTYVHLRDNCARDFHKLLGNRAS